MDLVHYFAVPLLLVLTGCFEEEPDKITITDESPMVDGPERLWVLIHPSHAPDGAGIFLVDLDSQTVISHFPLPEGVISPHALCDDGNTLWMSGVAQEQVYAIDRRDGEVTQTFGGWVSEGIAASGSELWVGGFGHVYSVNDELEVETTYAVASVIQDIAWLDGQVYVLRNGSGDDIRQLDPTTGQVSTVTPSSSMGNTSYGLTAWEDRLLVADTFAGQWEGANVIRHIDPQTGDWLGITSVPVRGAVTAIAVFTE